MRTLGYALAYARRGWPVFPCTGKRPATPNGFHDATCDEQQLRAWFDRSPSPNIAIACGDRLAVLDIDPRHDPRGLALPDLLAQLGAIPDAVPQVMTGGGGAHFYFAGPHRTVANLNGSPWAEIRGQGAYIIAPPSIHPETARQYVFLREPRQALQPLPSRLRKPLAAAARPVEEYVSIATGIVGEGERHNVLRSLIGHILRRGVDPRVAWPLIDSWARLHIKPPLPAAQVQRLFSDLVTAEQRRRATHDDRRAAA